MGTELNFNSAEKTGTAPPTADGSILTASFWRARRKIRSRFYIKAVIRIYPIKNPRLLQE
jgi:cell division protein FtsI/penicillin-binding protein 2